MDFIRAVVLLGTIVKAVNSEHHSLTYIYTALSKPVDLPGIHEFTAMGLLDHRMIDYYDSKIQKKIPKQPWMKERLEPDYWTKGTTSRQSKEQWFKVNVNILMDRMRQVNDTIPELHVLQWSHGCEVDLQTDGSKTFVKGTDHYSYDGRDFLSFDDVNMRWIAPVAEAIPTKRKWDTVQILNQYTKGYLHKECVDWLEKFVTYGNGELAKASPPEVYVFAKEAKTLGNIHLVCMATGFYPKDVVLEIRKNKRTLDQLDGVESTGVRPNEDDTFQIRMSVEIRKDDRGGYDCYVHHSTLKEPIVKEWDKKCDSCKPQIVKASVITAIVSILLILAAFALIAFVLHRRGIIAFPRRQPEVKSEIQREAQPEPQHSVDFSIPNDIPLKDSPGTEDGTSDLGTDSISGSASCRSASIENVDEDTGLLPSSGISSGAIDEHRGLLEDPAARE